MRYVISVVALAVAAGSARAQTTAADSLLTVGSYLDLEQVSDPQISPDGKTIVYTRTWVDQRKDRTESAIWVMDADGGRNRFLAKGGGPVWSPDGTRIAYLAAGEGSEGAQIFVRWMDAEGATSQITRVSHGPRSVTWSPDGKWLSFGMFVPKMDDWAIDLPAPPPGATWTPGPRIVDRLHYRADRQGYTQPGFVHLFVVQADGGTPRQLTSGDWSVGAAFDGMAFGAAHSWSPDGRTIYFDGYAESDGDHVYGESNVYAVDVATGIRRRLTADRGFWSGPVVSPDGKRVAYTGHPYTTRVWQVADLWVMHADGSGATDLSRSLDREIGGFAGAAVHWAPDGTGLYFSAQDRGTENVWFAPAGGGPIRAVTEGAEMLSLGSLAGATAVGVVSRFDSPPEVARITLDGRGGATPTPLTEVNADLVRGKRLASVDEIWYRSSGGARIQGWIVKPPRFDPTKKYPMLLEIHGGPQSMYGVGFDMMWQVFAAQGYVVLFTNPRAARGMATPSPARSSTPIPASTSTT